MSSASFGMMANPKPRTLLTNGAVMPNGSRTYVVCGVQRGGTSMVGAVLGALGIDMGAVGFNYEDAAFFASEQDLDGYIARRNRSAIWGLKIPHLSLSLDNLAQRLRHPVFILVFRNPVATLDSVIVRGDARMADGLDRIDTYTHAMLRFAQHSEQAVILVSYERAAADPAKFIEEAEMALGLRATPDQRRDAIRSVTGDGGGYTHPPARWHHIDVRKSSKPPLIVPAELIKARFFQIHLVGLFAPSGRTHIGLHVDLDPDAPEAVRWVQLLVDFGSGFDMLNTYSLHYPRGSAIYFRHQGSVQRLGVGFRPNHAEIRGVWVETQD